MGIPKKPHRLSSEGKNTHATSKNNKLFPASENHPSDFRFITPLKNFMVFDNCL